MPGKVVRVADGLTDKRSARAKKILPAGALLWARGRPTATARRQQGSRGSSSSRQNGTGRCCMADATTPASARPLRPRGSNRRRRRGLQGAPGAKGKKMKAKTFISRELERSRASEA